MGRPAWRGFKLQVEASLALRFGRGQLRVRVGFRRIALLFLAPRASKNSCRAGGNAGTPEFAAPA